MSIYAEKEIMEEAIKAIEESGELSTTELKDILNDIMKPDGEDLKINKNRNDTKFDQKVRNIISHRNNNSFGKYLDYEKRGRVGILKAKSIGNSIETVNEDSPEYGNGNKVNSRKEKKRKFNARKVDFDELNKRNKEIGYQGELFVLENEKENLTAELSDKVRHIAEEDGDGTGYDILSYNNDGEVKFLEVKTTTGKAETPFFLSENEKLFLETYEEEAEIVRVYDFDMENKIGNIFRISGNEFFEKFELRPIAYKVMPKNKIKNDRRK